MELAPEMVCSMCGERGFQEFLRPCSKCGLVFQHVYCMAGDFATNMEQRNIVLTCDSCTQGESEDVPGGTNGLEIVDDKRGTLEVVLTIEEEQRVSTRPREQAGGAKRSVYFEEPPSASLVLVKQEQEVDLGVTVPVQSDEMEAERRRSSLDGSASRNNGKMQVEVDVQEGLVKQLSCKGQAATPKNNETELGAERLESTANGHEGTVEKKLQTPGLSEPEDKVAAQLTSNKGPERKRRRKQTCTRKISSETVSSPRAEPASTSCWRGTIELTVLGSSHVYRTMAIFLSNTASSKVQELSHHLAETDVLKLQGTSRRNIWPSRFHTTPPSSKDIAMFCLFEPGSEGSYCELLSLVVSVDLVLHTDIGSSRLCIAASCLLNESYQLLGSHTYLWGYVEDN